MLFTDPAFIGLVLVTALMYYLPILRQWQVPVLVGASLTFYAYGQANLLWLLLVSVGINIVASYLVVYGRAGWRRFHAIWGVVANLGILLFFKYGPLLGHTFMPPASAAGAWLVSLPLPIGISFFTFQGISLVVDTYRNRDVAAYRSLIARNIIKHAQTVLFFKGFFPQLVAGPIVKAHFFLPQIGPKRFADIQWDYCFRTLVLGYFLKMVVADNLKDHTIMMTHPPYFEGVSSLTLLTLLLGYSMQIFADFAGYSLIALGLAALFGYQFPINFNFPYISASFAEFWRRWHISLSSFLREYLYIPLGGNRHGQVRTYLNLMATMVLGGLWHGAAWSYAVWGLAHGLALAAERFVGDRIDRRHLTGLRLARMVLVFGYVTMTWLLFRLPDFSHVLTYLRALGTNLHKPHDMLTVWFIGCYTVPVVLYHAHYLLREQASRVSSGFYSRLQYVDTATFGLLLFLLITNKGSSGTFIYFQF